MTALKLKLNQAGIGLVLFIVSSAAGWAQSHQLVFTEESDTVLTARLDGGSSDYGTVVNTSADHWIWHSPAFVIGGGHSLLGRFLGGFAWQEPGGEPGQNYVSGVGLNTTTAAFRFDLVSDGDNPFDVVPDGSIGGTVSIDVDGVNVFNSDIYFVDRTDRSSVPDSGCGLGMLFLTFSGLVGASRVRVGSAF